MDQSNFTMAQFHLSDKSSYIVIISDGEIHFFDINGKSVERAQLDLPDVFVIYLNEGENRAFILVNEGETIPQMGFYVINKSNRVICTPDEGQFTTYSRITDNSIVLGIDEIPKSSELYVPTETNDRLVYIFDKGDIVTKCVCKNIEATKYYLFMEKLDGQIDIIYTYDNIFCIYENYSSVNLASMKLNFANNIYTNDEAIIVSKDGKYGIICRDKIIAECIYDDIKLINADPKTNILYGETSRNPIWFVLRIGKKKGVVRIDSGLFQTEIKYRKVNVIDWRTCHPDRDYSDCRRFVLELDGIIYTADAETTVCQNRKLRFVGFIDSNVLAFSNDDRELELYDCKGRRRNFMTVDTDGDVIDSEGLDISSLYDGYAVLLYNNEDADVKCKKYAFSIYDNEVVINPFYKYPYDPDDDDNYYHSNTYDDHDYTDYDKETYYALGGDDYDSFRENGGSIDDMMDGMGF